MARRAPYAAGWVSGAARQGRFGDLVRLHDEDRAMEHLRAREAPALLVLDLFFRALCREGRQGEAAALLPVRVLLQRPDWIPLLLTEGTRVLRDDNGEGVRPLFDRLGERVRELEAEGEPTTESWFLEIRRRRAHCYRQLGDVENARELLERLLRGQPVVDFVTMRLSQVWRDEVVSGPRGSALQCGHGVRLPFTFPVRIRFSTRASPGPRHP